MDPVTLFIRLLSAGGRSPFFSYAVLPQSGGSARVPDFAGGTLEQYNEDRPRPAPFADRQTFFVVHRCRDFRVFVGRNAPAPQIASWPSDDPEPSLSLVSDVVYSSPSWFVRNRPAPYALDPFDGMGPPTKNSIILSADLAAVWDDQWVVHTTHGYTIKKSIADWIHDLDKLLDRVLHALKQDHVRIGVPQPAESPTALKEAWRAWAIEIRGLRAIVGFRLVGNGGWKHFKETFPALWEQLMTFNFFENSMVGAWFADPIRERSFLIYLVKIGVPVYYEWTAEMAADRSVKELEPPGGLRLDEMTRTAPFNPRFTPRQQLDAIRAGVAPDVFQTEPVDEARLAALIAKHQRGAQGSSVPNARPLPVPHEGCAHDPRPLAARISDPPRKKTLAERISSPQHSPERTREPSPPDVPMSYSFATRGVRPLSAEDPYPVRSRTLSAVPDPINIGRRDLVPLYGHTEGVQCVASGWMQLRWWDGPQVRIHATAVEFVFNQPRDDEPRLLARGPAYMLTFLRQLEDVEPIQDHLQFIETILKHHIVLVTGITVENPQPEGSISAHVVSAEMKCRETMGYATAYEHWRKYARVVLERPHGYRAARKAGGLYARIAVELLKGARFPVMPTDEIYHYGCPDPTVVDGVELHDDWLSADEQKILLGYDWDSKPDSPRLLFPHPNMWEKYAGGVWMPWHDDWFNRRMSEIRYGQGGAHFLAHNQITGTRRFSDKCPRM
ncbi:hypothetical protein EXIGLDRAFT_764154 [Exidia glandulosa HHB12029]|uniref:Uncharacterized protein n=1 Tax=Exidia glandulosa HHB12029 TaxID=1314781 RepID=A0A166B4F0_EXIGL|nr:hypothetical protein EXIGLDRAFT_764154 [Exidia glandulosa HHB12029]